MGYTIVLHLQDIEHDETTYAHFGHFDTFKECEEAMLEVGRAAKEWPEDEDLNRLVVVGWRALREYNIDNINTEATRFIKKGRRKRQ